MEQQLVYGRKVVTTGLWKEGGYFRTGLERIEISDSLRHIAAGDLGPYLLTPRCKQPHVIYDVSRIDFRGLHPPTIGNYCSVRSIPESARRKHF